jgi:hypothetical protein
MLFDEKSNFSCKLPFFVHKSQILVRPQICRFLIVDRICRGRTTQLKSEKQAVFKYRLCFRSLGIPIYLLFHTCDQLLFVCGVTSVIYLQPKGALFFLLSIFKATELDPVLDFPSFLFSRCCPAVAVLSRLSCDRCHVAPVL